MNNQKQAEKDYLSGMKYKDIADKYHVSINTVKSWKKRYGWQRTPNKKGAHKTAKATKDFPTIQIVLITALANNQPHLILIAFKNPIGMDFTLSQFEHFVSPSNLSHPNAPIR